MNGHFENKTKDIRNILIEAGADTKIVDMNGKSYIDWIDEYKKKGTMIKDYRKSRKDNGNR